MTDKEQKLHDWLIASDMPLMAEMLKERANKEEANDKLLLNNLEAIEKGFEGWERFHIENIGSSVVKVSYETMKNTTTETDVKIGNDVVKGFLDSQF